MKDLWIPQAVLSNVSVSEAIEAECAAFVPPEDPRICAIDREHPIHAKFLKRFTDAFENKLSPTILLLSPSASPTYATVNSVASIRDVLSLSVVPGARAQHMCRGHGPGIYFSSAFDFYPWMLDREYQNLICHTPAVLGTHVVEQFRGQRSPGITACNLRRDDLDAPIWTALIRRWGSAYGTNEPKEGSLMRSLNMAHHACQLPANQDTRHFDYGRQIALWVSAFEILAHPQEGKVDKSTVCKLLDQAPWTQEQNRTKTRGVEAHRDRHLTLPAHLYLRMNDVRNDYVHGNPITSEALDVPGTERILADFAAPLYRMALTASLGLGPPDSESLSVEAIVDRIQWNSDFRDFEAAIAMYACGMSTRDIQAHIEEL